MYSALHFERGARLVPPNLVEPKSAKVAMIANSLWSDFGFDSTLVLHVGAKITKSLPFRFFVWFNGYFNGSSYYDEG
jgi:hypothetical protein